MAQGKIKSRGHSGKPSHQSRKQSKFKSLINLTTEPKQGKNDTFAKKTNIKITRVRSLKLQF